MQIIHKGDNVYPQLLSLIKNPPECLYVMGDSSILNSNTIAVIGSRNMTDYGREITKNIVKDLTLAGMCIVSGLALGIDSVAHRTCLENGGRTIAVLGCGFNNIFPPENMSLYNQIINNGGCVISEYPPDEYFQKKYFPMRNRIVSGISLGTLVIEATYRSGTSITANFTIKQGRKLFCIPNCVGNKNSEGILKLLKKGAILVTNANEILQELGIKCGKLDSNINHKTQKKKESKVKEKQELKDLDNTCTEIYNYIKENKVINSEVLCSYFNLEISNINAYLTILELKGLITSISGRKL